jgi:hypothetical protein
MTVPHRLKIYDKGTEEFYLASADPLPKGTPRGTIGEMNSLELAEAVVERYNGEDALTRDLLRASLGLYRALEGVVAKEHLEPLHKALGAWGFLGVQVPPIEEWVEIEDRKVQHIWAPKDGGLEVPVDPNFYADSGIPLDSETDEELVYLRTEILQDPK